MQTLTMGDALPHSMEEWLGVTKVCNITSFSRGFPPSFGVHEICRLKFNISIVVPNLGRLLYLGMSVALLGKCTLSLWFGGFSQIIDTSSTPMYSVEPNDNPILTLDSSTFSIFLSVELLPSTT